ncbi:reverse transcriptase domain-containing protein [Tanacetum coccineum]
MPITVSSDVAELKDIVRALLLDKKNQASAPAPAPAPVKAVELSCVTCGGAHSHQNCPATHGNVYRDNISEYVSQAAAANYNQVSSNFRPQMVANHIRPPGFPPVQNSQANNANNFNRGNNFNQNRESNFNQNRGGNFNQSNFSQNQLHRPQVNQSPAYQAPVPQTHSVTKNDFDNYVKANDAIMRNMQNNLQNQGQSMQIETNKLNNQMANLTDMLAKFVTANTASTSGSGTLPGNTVTNPREDLKGITTRSGVAYQGPPIPTSSVVKPIPEVTKDQVHPSCSQSTAPVQPPVGPEPITTPVFEPIVAPVVAPVPNTKPSVSLPYPSRRDNEKSRNQANEQIDKFYEIFKEMSFEISFTDALVLMPKFASTLRTLLGNKEKLTEVARTSNEPCLARTSMNEHCSAVILNKLPRKLGDPGKFLIPCEFPGMDECLALADLGASINLMPFSVWEKLSLPDLTPTCMTLELADRSISKPMGIAKDISVKVGVFHFPADFVVVDFEPDPRVPLILGRCFLKTSRALIDVHKGELTLRIGSEAITYNLDQTSRYSANYTHMTANKIDVIDMACEEYSQEVLGFTDIIASGNSTPYYDPIVATSSPTLTPFGDSDFLLLEEADSFLGLADDPDCPAYNPFYYDPEGDILLLEAILNSEPPPPLPNHKTYLPEVRTELKVCETNTANSSVDEPTEVELKELPPHLEYAFLEGDNKLPVIIAKELDVEEKSALVKVLKSHKRALAWKLSDIQGINPEFCTHKILMEEDYAPAVQHQRRVNPKIHDVIKKEVEKLLEAGLIYPISDSPWVSPIHCVPKKGGMTVGELTLRIGSEAITYNLDQTSRYSANYTHMTANKIDVIDMACEEYSQEVLGFTDIIASGNSTPYYDPIVATSSPTLTPFGDSDFLLLEEADSFLGLADDPDCPAYNPFYYDPEGDILILEAILNSEPPLPPPSQGTYLPEVRTELKVCETNTANSSVDEPTEVELKELPPHLEYAFLEGDNKLPVIIAKELDVEEKSALIKVLKSHKRALAWKLSDIQGINPEFCTHKILMEEDYAPAVQHQRRVNPKIHDVIKKEVEKLLEAGLIYPISDSPWVSPIHCVPKKGGMTVVVNEENELIPTRLVTGWRVCIDYRKLNEATRKDHFPLPFMDQMLERLAGNEYYCFLDGFSGYFQIPIDPRDQEKTTFTCPYGTFAYRRMPFGLCNAPGTFQRCMLAIFHDMVEKTMEVFMDDFSVFGNSFQNCLSRLDHMLQRCEDTNLSLNWEKSHFMVKEGIVLGHKISKKGIEVDKAKIDVIAKLPHPTTVKGIRSFLVHTDHSALKYLFAKKDAKARLLRWVLLLQEFDFKVIDTKGAMNLAADLCPGLEKNPRGVHGNEALEISQLATMDLPGTSRAKTS